MRAVALALVALCLPVAASAADGPGGLGPAAAMSTNLTPRELGPCDPGSGASSFDRVAACTDLIRIGKADAAVYTARAAALADSGDRAAAIADLSAAIRLDPGAAAAYALRGTLYLRDEAFRDGLVDLDRALTLSPNDEETLRTRAFAWDELGNYPDAIADYTALIALSHDDSYRYFRGFAYFHSGNVAAAVADFNAILTAASPTLAAWGYRGRGLIREQTGAYAAALADYSSALALDPADDRAFAGRCRVEQALARAAAPGCASAVRIGQIP